jgi:hypothetical protein
MDTFMHYSDNNTEARAHTKGRELGDFNEPPLIFAACQISNISLFSLPRLCGARAAWENNQETTAHNSDKSSSGR